jgi:hypothetical protein
MEEELLQEMIRDRETQIKWIERKMEEQTIKMAQTKQELQGIKEALKNSTVQQQEQVDELQTRHAKLIKDYNQAKEAMDMKKQQTALHVYQEAMKSVATSPESKDSSYVLRMQAQLCKAMHSMGIVENQLGLATNQSESLTKYLSASMTGTMEEKSQVELKLMNDLLLVDSAKRDVETKHKTMMEEYLKEKESLEKLIEGHEDEDASEEEDDEEREELMEILTQGREEVQRMQEEMKQQKEKIEKLREKIAAQRGIPVEDLDIGIIPDDYGLDGGGDEDEEEEEEDEQ